MSEELFIVVRIVIDGDRSSTEIEFIGVKADVKGVGAESAPAQQDGQSEEEEETTATVLHHQAEAR